MFRRYLKPPTVYWLGPLLIVAVILLVFVIQLAVRSAPRYFLGDFADGSVCVYLDVQNALADTTQVVVVDNHEHLCWFIVAPPRSETRHRLWAGEALALFEGTDYMVLVIGGPANQTLLCGTLEGYLRDRDNVIHIDIADAGGGPKATVRKPHTP